MGGLRAIFPRLTLPQKDTGLACGMLGEREAGGGISTQNRKLRLEEETDSR
jgi:hypothetical protein